MGGTSWPGSMIAGPPSADVVAEFDFALTTAALCYLSDLHNGRVNPANLQFNLDGRNKQFDAAEFLREHVIHAADVNLAFALVEPDFAGYRRTLKALQDYLTLAAAGDGDPIPASPRPLKPGDAYSGTLQLAERLRRLGDLAPEATAPASANKYAGPLVDAVRRFQKRHGLEPDGIIGPETLEQLTTPISRRVTQLALTLERWRWLPDDLKPPLIVVNIPEFQLRAYEDHSASLSMRAIVGNAEGHQTPVFADQLESVVFHPYWNVPESIQKEELLPILSRDPSYLAKHQLEVVNRRGEPVTGDVRSPEFLEQLRSGKLSLRQRPGPANSLGLLKFSFPNQYSIYIHGTPGKAALFVFPARPESRLYSRGRSRSFGRMGLARQPAMDAETHRRRHAQQNLFTGQGPASDSCVYCLWNGLCGGKRRGTLLRRHLWPRCGPGAGPCRKTQAVAPQSARTGMYV